MARAPEAGSYRDPVAPHPGERESGDARATGPPVRRFAPCPSSCLARPFIRVSSAPLVRGRPSKSALPGGRTDGPLRLTGAPAVTKPLAIARRAECSASESPPAVKSCANQSSRPPTIAQRTSYERQSDLSRAVQTDCAQTTCAARAILMTRSAFDNAITQLSGAKLDTGVSPAELSARSSISKPFSPPGQSSYVNRGARFLRGGRNRHGRPGRRL